MWLEYPPIGEVFVSSGSCDKPYVVGRMRAGHVLAGLQGKTRTANSIARDVLTRFQKKADAANSIRAHRIRGIACVIVEGKSPVSPHSPYRLVLSSVEPFK